MITKLPVLDPKDRRLNLFDQTGQKITDTGTLAAINVAFTELRAEPDFHCNIDTQLIFGETVRVHDLRDGWAWVQAERDHYVGWLEASTLIYEPAVPTHLVCAPRTFFYPQPDLKLPHKGMRSIGSALRIVGSEETRGTRYSILESGEAVISSHIRPVNEHATDFVSVAETLIHTPYLWAGTSAFGMDCSGLVKITKYMCGESVLRDSDMQAASIGEPFEPESSYENVERGDLIFWRGHVGICQGRADDGTQMLIHANGHTMNVASEPLIDAIERIAYLYENPIGMRRG